MVRKIVATGRGGAGKSSFVALMLRFLKPPSLLIDLDPDGSLADMLGLDFVKEKKITVSEALYDVIDKRRRGNETFRSTYEIAESLLWSDCLYEEKGFDLLALGTKLTEGCYCPPDEILKRTILKLAGNYANVVVDSPAGVEHLNRNIISEIDDIFVLCDPSEKSLKHIGRIKRIIQEVGISYRNFYLVANHEFDEKTEEYLRGSGEVYLGRIDHDATLEHYNIVGKSLRQLPDDSPAAIAVKKILSKARLLS